MINKFINIYNICNYFEFNIRYAYLYYKVRAYFSFFTPKKLYNNYRY